MKIISYLLMSALLNLIPQVSFSDTGHGGDLCKAQILSIRDEIKNWITKDGAQKLQLREGLSYSVYKEEMLKELDQLKDSAISCINEKTDSPDACDYSERAVSLTCNASKFMAKSPVDRYILIHHHYAFFAKYRTQDGNENRIENASDYSISGELDN